jgi:hypothetical protein
LKTEKRIWQNPEKNNKKTVVFMVFSVVSPTNFLWFPTRFSAVSRKCLVAFSKWGLAGSYYAVDL